MPRSLSFVQLEAPQFQQRQLTWPVPVLDELQVRGAYGFPRRTGEPSPGELHACRMSWPLPPVPAGRVITGKNG